MSVIFFLVCVVVVKTVFSSTSCLTPNGETAFCIDLRECKTVLQSLTAQDNISKQFYNESGCGNHTVCCGTLGNYTKLPIAFKENATELTTGSLAYFSDPKACGLQEQSPYKILGGEKADVNELPWMVALEYESQLTQESEGVKCGGTIINSKYILTAAHCIESRGLRVIRAWLGFLNASADGNCIYSNDGNKLCLNSTQKINVAERIVHRDYKRRSYQNDIGLLRLEKEITFTDSIRPICLRLSNSQSLENVNMTVAGWGLNDKRVLSDVLLKVQLPIRPNSVCNRIFNKNITSNQLCVGAGDINKDSCEGDSGGPLLTKVKNRWYQEGIVSYGPSQSCSSGGRPGIYTRVSEYITWIGEKIRSNT